MSKKHGPKFINPYNFVSLLPRDTATNPFPDSRPAPHGKASGISGTVTIELTTLTPLLLPAEDRYSGNTKGTRVDGLDKPLMLGSSLKGALRAAYEAITNSRYGTFDVATHSSVGSQRQESKQGSNVVPCIVESVDASRESATFRILNKECAAKLPKRLGDVSLDMQRTRAVVSHSEKSSRYTVQRLVPSGAKADEVDLASNESLVEGIVHWTGSEIRGKKNERLFITGVLKSTSDHLENILARSANYTKKDLVKDWDDLIHSYRMAAEEFEKTNDGTGARPGTYADPKYAKNWELQPGRTAWFDPDSELLSPSMIGRTLFDASPWKLIENTSHRPATTLDELSAADRVFGWVPRENTSTTAHRAQLSIGSVQYRSCANGSNPVVHFSQPLDLAVLNGGKTNSAGFYATNSYRQGSSLRGRKFYVAHQGRFVTKNQDKYWDDPLTKKSKREFLLPEASDGKDQSNVAIAISSWVNYGVTFRCQLQLHNVAHNDAAALLWLLDISNNTIQFKQPGIGSEPVLLLGLGKPLGFGATRCKIVASDLRDDEDTTNRYSMDALFEPRPLRVHSADADSETSAHVEELKQHFTQFFDGDNADPSIRQAVREFYLMVAGFGKNTRIHYPRLTNESRGKQYEWWQKSTDATLPMLNWESGEAPFLEYPPQ
ncbi:hypothetical protein GW964_00310 [Corynebacterium godavarianum]|nr:RAMP superfamily CRISPR-associated protein [Corynebacterium godavarianum]MBL7284710.1 hypothetical protein [Corynebacterium godavarianum]